MPSPVAGRGRPGLTSGLPNDLEGEQQPQVQIPNLVTDPVWSLDLFPLEIDFGDRTFDVAALPAARWLAHLMGPEVGLYSLVLDIFSELEEYLFDNLGLVSIADLYTTVLEAISAVAGRPWWVAVRLIRSASDNWHIVGPQMIMAGIDARAIPLGAWLDCALYIMVQAMDPKDVQMFSLKLEAKPDLGALDDGDETVDPMESMVTDRSAFLAMGA